MQLLKTNNQHALVIYSAGKLVFTEKGISL
jgi:hypothetical protein